jgi:hypothetical protein
MLSLLTDRQLLQLSICTATTNNRIVNNKLTELSPPILQVNKQTNKAEPEISTDNGEKRTAYGALAACLCCLAPLHRRPGV